MRIIWRVTEPYADEIRQGLEAALTYIPREHLVRLTEIVAYDTDPKGERLGVYFRDHRGNRIELYLQPHLLRFHASPLPGEHSRAVVLHLAHTLFHEVGHHLTLTVNPRRKPSRKSATVSEKLETWAEQYAAKRLEKFAKSDFFGKCLLKMPHGDPPAVV